MSSPAEAAATKLSWEMGTWKSIEIRLRSDNENRDPARKREEPRTFKEATHYIETAAGQRLFDSELSTDLNNEVAVEINYLDGSRSATLFRTDREGVKGPEQVRIQREFGVESLGSTHRPEHLKYFYVGLKPLPDALPRAVLVGEGRRLDRDCDKFLFTHVKGSQDPVSLVYWLDRATGVALRMEYYDDEQARAEARPDHVWNAESLDTVNGHHLALKSELVQFDRKGADPTRVLMRYKITTDEVVFDRDYPKSTFWPVVTKETTVVDFLHNKLIQPKRKAESKATSAKSIQAVDSQGWEAYYSNAAMLLGLSAVGMGIVLRWRRERRTEPT